MRNPPIPSGYWTKVINDLTILIWAGVLLPLSNGPRRGTKIELGQHFSLACEIGRRSWFVLGRSSNPVVRFMANLETPFL